MGQGRRENGDNKAERRAKEAEGRGERGNQGMIKRERERV